MTSERKIAANRRNAAKSTGPTTKDGKHNSRRNAMKSGFYAQVLYILPDEEPEYQALRNELDRQFMPATAMQKIGFDQIVSIIWRSRRALLKETITVDVELGLLLNNRSENLEDSAGNMESSLSAWMGAPNQPLRDALRFLAELRAEVATYGLMNLTTESWKERILKTFGQQFYDLLMEWKDFSISEIQLTEHLHMHRKIFPPRSEDPMKLGETKVITDPKLKWQMVVKLIDLHEIHLHQFLTRNSLSQSPLSRSEVCPRYFAAACRDLHRAVEWYLYLLEKKL